MKTLVSSITLLLVTLSGVANEEMKPLDKDIPLAEGIRQANERFPDVQPLTEEEVVAAAKAIKLQHPDIKQEVYEIYLRVVNDRVLPKGMFFRHITTWTTQYGRFQVDWMDLCLEGGRVPTVEERKEILSKLPGIHLSDQARVGGCACRIRARFVSSAQPSPAP